MNENDKLIAEQLKTLPPNLQQAINTVEWKMLVKEIAEANGLNAEQSASLEQETMFIIYAFESPEDYIQNIVREIGIPEDLADTIAESVAEKIFGPIQKNSEKAPQSERIIAINAAMAPGGGGAAMVSEDIKSLSEKELEMINPAFLVEPSFVTQLQQTQLDAVAKSDVFTLSQKSNLKTATKQPLTTAFSKETLVAPTSVPSTPAQSSGMAMEIAPEIHPVVEGKMLVANVIPKVPEAQIPDYRYPEGKDPYREPLV